MRANVYGRYDRDLMVNKYSEKLARLYNAQVDLYKLIIEDAETSTIEAAISRIATLSSELTETPDIPETVKEWHERITEKAFPKKAISGSPNSAARGTAPPAAGSGVPRSATNASSPRQIKPTAAAVAKAHRQPRKRASPVGPATTPPCRCAP
jgi:hypothetical protein